MIPTFSVVIPAKNEERSLPHLLREIKEQTLQPLEVIVADAASTDGTAQAAQAFGARVVKGGLPGAGRNAGAHVAEGEVLVFLDADVYLQDPEFFTKLLTEFVKRDLDLGGMTVHVVEGGSLARFAHGVYNVYAHLTWSLFRLPHAAGACIVVRCKVFDALHGFSEELPLAEDMDFALRASPRFSFGILRSVKLGLDMRRMEHDGWLRLVTTYLRGELTMLFLGRVPRRANYALDYERPERKKVQ